MYMADLRKLFNIETCIGNEGTSIVTLVEYCITKRMSRSPSPETS